MLTKFASIGSYPPEIGTFGTLIMSTKVFSLIVITYDSALNMQLPSPCMGLIFCGDDNGVHTVKNGVSIYTGCRCIYKKRV